MASLVIVVAAVLVLSCGQTDTQTDADECFTPATILGVSNDVAQCNKRCSFTY